MSTFDILKAVEALGGQLRVVDGQLKVSASRPLPPDLIDDIAAHKSSIKIALGVPEGAVFAAILDEIRPHLPPAMQQLDDDRLLILVQWRMLVAWKEALRTLHA